MISLAVNGYTKEQTIKALHAENRLVKIRYDLLNRNDVKIGEISALPGNSITFNSEAEIKRTGVFNLKDSNDIDWLNDRIRPVYCLRMPRGWAEWPLGIFLVSSPVRTEDSGIKRSVEAYDQSVILVEDKFDNRYRIPAGTKYTAAITTILNDTGIAKINILDHEGTMGVDKEFEIGTPKIKAINQLLSEINYTSIWVDTNGYFIAKPYTLPSEREVEYEYRTDALSLIEHGASEEVDLFSVPNKWVVVCSTPEKAELVSRYTNDLPTSKTSTYSRGRTITDFQKVDDIYDQTTLDDYTKRLAYNASWVYGQLSFSTAKMPHHGFQDCLFVDHTDMGIQAKYIETSWTMNLEGNMRHECKRVIRI